MWRNHGPWQLCHTCAGIGIERCSVRPRLQHLPSRALAIRSARRKQSLEYVLPLQPQTGWGLLLFFRAMQRRGRATHTPPVDSHPPAAGSHHRPLSQTASLVPPQGWPTGTACA
jgi:hypothetical protein